MIVMIQVVFWVMTPCSLVNVTCTVKEPTASTFRVEEAAFSIKMLVPT